MSADLEPADVHVPRHGASLTAPEGTLKAVNDFAVRAAKHVWARMRDAKDLIPLGHDGYLKLWALSKPVIAADFILMDETQDTNPVVLDVLRGQPSQMIYVGDKDQQIYEWRGAVNAMEAITTDYETYLTTSFRFGAGIAEGATKLLGLLGESGAIHGNPALSSRIGPTPAAGTILARTDAYTIAAVIEALDANMCPHLVGGTDDLMKMLRGVSDLKRGEPSDVPDFFGFANWQEVVEFAKPGEGQHLQTFVILVQARGEPQLMWALRRTAEVGECDLVVSTAHKSQGREWPTVRLVDDFVKSLPGPKRVGSDLERPIYDPSELRLLYVALTRAKVSVEVPPPLFALVGVSAIEAEVTPSMQNSQWRPAPSPAPSGHHARRPSGEPTTQIPPVAKPQWDQPQNWKPEVAPSQPIQHTTAPKPHQEAPKRKGILRWLFG